MGEDDLRALEATIERTGTVSGDDARSLVAEHRRLTGENAYLRAALEASRAARVTDYGTEERHDRPRPFTHQHYHAHYGKHQRQDGAHTRHEGEFSHPHRHGVDDDHHRP